MNQGGAFSADQRISGCSSIIESGHQTGRNLAVAYYSRGLAYYDKGDDDRAIAEYNEAIRLDPKFAYAYSSRGLAYDHKGDLGHAEPDYNEAIRLDPKYAQVSTAVKLGVTCPEVSRLRFFAPHQWRSRYERASESASVILHFAPRSVCRCLLVAASHLFSPRTLHRA